MRHPQFQPNLELLTDQCRIFRPGEAMRVARAPLTIDQDQTNFGLPGVVPPDAWSVLDHVVGIIHRITPWATVHAVPTLIVEVTDDIFSPREIIRRKDSNKIYVKAGGKSYYGEGLIALSLSTYAPYLISAAYHEAWHQIEKILYKKILDEIDANLIPMTWGSAYLDSASERRARCFETWAMRFEEGMPGLRLSSRVDEIFDAAATGETSRLWTLEQENAAKRTAVGWS